MLGLIENMHINMIFHFRKDEEEILLNVDVFKILLLLIKNFDSLYIK
jgi:hypothetical protein